jgi:hypothetical protein
MPIHGFPLRWDFMCTGSLNANKDTKELSHKGDLEPIPLLLDVHWLLISGSSLLDLIDCASGRRIRSFDKIKFSIK